MMENRVLLLLLLLSFPVFSQIKGIVVDENNKPVPYVSIWAENENTGTTSEADGTFSINIDKNKNLIFSSLGFEKKTVRAAEAEMVQLKALAYDLKEVIIWNKKETKEIEIGKTESALLQAFDNGPRMNAKFFPYASSYKKTKFIKYITIFTDSGIENATIKIHIYAVDANGFPGEELMGKDFIVTVKKGVLKHKVNVADFNLIMPKEGVFVAFEKLMIESNKKENVITDANTKTTTIQKAYFPFVLYNVVEHDFSYTFSGGKWVKQLGKTNDPSVKARVFEPAINIILTN